MTANRPSAIWRLLNPPDGGRDGIEVVASGSRKSCSAPIFLQLIGGKLAANWPEYSQVQGQGGLRAKRELITPGHCYIFHQHFYALLKPV